MDIEMVGVVGCGVMGAGIAQVCAQAGYRVTVSEVNQTLLDKGINAIAANLLKAVKKGKFTELNKENALKQINGTVEIKDLAECDIVIEAVIENLDLKKRVFAALDEITKSQTVLATNTSCLSVTDIARTTGRPDKVLGLHFFNPVPQMALLEIVSTIMTSEDTTKIGKMFGQSLGKSIVMVKDTPGFIANRLAWPMILNAIRMLENGTASRDDIDNALKLGLNHPLGPLALADVVGLDVVLAIADSMYLELKDPQFAAPTLLKRMVTAGWLGRKTGKGFYDYNNNFSIEGAGRFGIQNDQF